MKRSTRHLRTWRGMLLATTTSSLVSTGILAAVAAVVSGWLSAASVAVGGGMVMVISGFSLLVVDVASRAAPHALVPLFMLTIFAKLIVLGVLLVVIPSPDWLHPGWCIGTVVAVVLAWQAAAAVALRRMRLAIGRLD